MNLVNFTQFYSFYYDWYHSLFSITSFNKVSELGIENQVIFAESSSEGAKNRFIYSDAKLHKLPTGVSSFLFHSSPILKGIIGSVLKEPFVPKLKTEIEDESVYSFFSRRFSESVARNLIDPMCHGIYAGNAKELSIRSCFTSMYNYEKEFGSIVKGMLLSKSNLDELKTLEKTYINPNFVNQMSKKPMWSFQDGLETVNFFFLSL